MEHGLHKGDFDIAQRLINDCRKAGILPLDICAEDGARQAEHVELARADADETPMGELVEYEVVSVEAAHGDAVDMIADSYTPYEFWHNQDCYAEMMVEKIDLKELFKGICRDFRMPLTNARGWSDINSRAAMMRRYAKMENAGKQCVLLYCGDFDPDGVRISDFIKKNLEDLERAVGWSPANLIIDRFGLNADFIEANSLPWIDGLETSSGKDLASPRHPDHFKPHVQTYLARFGPRKVEANALVVRSAAGRELCRQAIGRYVNPTAPAEYQVAIDDAREQLRQTVLEKLGEID